MPKTLFAPALGLLVEIVHSYHIDSTPLMLESGIDPASISDANARLPLNQVRDFYDKAAELIPDSNFGLRAGQFWHPSQMGALGYGWMTSSTLRTAFKRLARFHEIINDDIYMEVIETSKSVSLVINFLDKAAMSAYRINTAMAVLLAMVRSSAGASFYPQSVRFTHPEPQDTGQFYSLFQCAITFNARTNRFTLSTAEADKPRACSNAQLALLNDQLLIEYLAKLDADNIVEKTKVAIIDELASGNVSDATVAEALNLHERTLQRRLREHGVTFKKLLNEVRRDLAGTYIRDNKLSLSEISFMLGFVEISSFSHAFKRWTGQSPTDYRQSSLD